MKMLLAALMLLAGPSFAAPCAVAYQDDPARFGLRRPHPLQASDPLCAQALQAERDFRRLRDAAGLRPEQARFTVYEEAQVNAAFDDRTHQLLLNTGLMRETRRMAIVAVMAHELGHAIQARDGVVTRDNRQFEGHADALGAVLLARAGYPPDTGRRAWESISGCRAISYPVRPQGTPLTHPMDGERWRNAAAMTAAIAEMRDGRLASAAFQGSRARVLPLPAVGEVTPDGVVRPGAYMRRVLDARVAPRLGPVENRLLRRGEVPPPGRLVVSERPAYVGPGLRFVATRRLLNAAEYLQALAHNRLVQAAAERVERLTRPGLDTLQLTTRMCGAGASRLRSLTLRRPS
jgi:hypothetical protein